MVDGASCETEAPGPCRSKNIQINSTRLAPMMAANVVQHKTRDPAGSVRCAGGRTTSRTRHPCARAPRVDPTSTAVCVFTYVRTYVRRCTCRVGVHIRGIYSEDQPPDPFRRRISVLPFLPLPLPFFLVFPTRRSPTLRATIHLSPGLSYTRREDSGPCW